MYNLAHSSYNSSLHCVSAIAKAWGGQGELPTWDKQICTINIYSINYIHWNILKLHRAPNWRLMTGVMTLWAIWNQNWDTSAVPKLDLNFSPIASSFGCVVWTEIPSNPMLCHMFPVKIESFWRYPLFFGPNPDIRFLVIMLYHNCFPMINCITSLFGKLRR